MIDNLKLTASALNSMSTFKSKKNLQQLSSTSLMLEYDIDNTLNAMKENQFSSQNKNSKDSLLMCKDEDKLNSPSAVVVTPLEPLSINCDNDMKIVLPPTPPSTPVIQNTARKRWKMLAKVLRKDSEEAISSSSEEHGEEQAASVRRFKSFDLLRKDSFEDHITLNCLGKAENWYKYRILLENQNHSEFTVNIHHMERHLTASDLMGFNNTGNICVWPSEEALTAFALSDLNAFNGKWILELGGGFTCLTGLMLSKYAKPFAVHLTDGNEISVENVKKTVCLNELSCYTKCSVLKWEDKDARAANEACKFDIILSADCLFFDDARSALVDTIWYYLSRTGTALIMAPQRGKTMNLFIEVSVARGFLVNITQRYNETIWKRHMELKRCPHYDEDLHYPFLLKLQKPPEMLNIESPEP
uniref:Calmodulin-lysine N-methyltransferase n=1 Tax=Glossina palpalis gambiensis TaxID=67801 RepID=A0A1B0AV13_9MUSC